jgi:hypothetical protein
MACGVLATTSRLHDENSGNVQRAFRGPPTMMRPTSTPGKRRTTQSATGRRHTELEPISPPRRDCASAVGNAQATNHVRCGKTFRIASELRTPRGSSISIRIASELRYRVIALGEPAELPRRTQRQCCVGHATSHEPRRRLTTKKRRANGSVEGVAQSIVSVHPVFRPRAVGLAVIDPIGKPSERSDPFGNLSEEILDLATVTAG